MKKLFEFYYKPLDVEPRTAYELRIAHETRRTFSGDAFKIMPSGKLEPCGKFRLDKARVELATVNSERIWMVRIPGESLEEAKRGARDLLRECISSWASHLLDEEG